METARRELVTALGGVRARPTFNNTLEKPSTSSRVLVVEEHELMAVGLEHALSGRDWEVASSSGPAAADVVDLAERFRPSCALLDIRLGDAIGSGIDLIEPLRSAGVHVVMLTAERRRSVLASCLEAGAAGWISKSASLDDVDSTLRRLLAGGSVVGSTKRAAALNALQIERAEERREKAIFEMLTHRELLVLAALTDGLSADEIAREDFVAVTTIRSQIRAVLQKLDVKSQLAAVAIAGVHRELLPERGSAKRDRRQSHARDDARRRSLSEHIA